MADIVVKDFYEEFGGSAYLSALAARAEYMEYESKRKATREPLTIEELIRLGEVRIE